MNDCTEGFLCLDAAEANGFDGCRRTCKEGEILVPDFSATDGTVSFFYVASIPVQELNSRLRRALRS